MVPNIIIAGDINIDILNDEDDSSNEYQSMLSEAGFCPAISLPTRLQSCLDHIYILNTSKSFSMQGLIGLTDITDHEIAMLGIRYSTAKRERNNRYTSKSDYQSIVTDLGAVDWSPILLSSEVSEAVTQLNKILTDTIKKHTIQIRTSRSKFNIRPWITPGLIRCMKHRDRLHLDHRNNPKNEIKKIVYKRYRNFFQQLLDKQRDNYHSQILSDNLKNPKSLWKTIKTITEQQQRTQPATELLNIKPNNPADSLNICNKYFANIGEDLAKKLIEKQTKTVESLAIAAKPKEESSAVSFFVQPTDEYEVGKIIQNLKDGSSGIDGLSTKFIKSIKSCILQPLTHIINLSISSGVFPKDWKRAVVVPIHKNGNKKCPENYRPISLLSILSKVLEKIMNSRLINYLEKNKLLSNYQFGFRKGKSTDDAVTLLVNSVSQDLDNKQRSIAIFLDLAKAFDTVSIDILLNKLEQCGIRGLPLKWFTSYLTERRQCVKVNDLVSEELPIKFGVPQGSVLGPTLFLIYINDIGKCLQESSLAICYADDTVLLFHSNSWEVTFQKAQEGLNRISKYLHTNLLTLNVKKTKYICFSITRATEPPPTLPDLQIHPLGEINEDSSCPKIERTTTIRYLGLVIDQHLNFKSHIALTAKRVRKLIHVMKLLRNSADKNTLKLVYRALCESVICYCIKVWGCAGKTAMLQLERAQRAVIKVTHKKPVRYPTDQIYEETKLLNVRKLYILNATISVHKKILTSAEYPRLLQRRAFFVPQTQARSTFATRFPRFAHTLIYNRILKTCSIKECTVRSAKHKISEYLLTLSYEQSEDIIRNEIWIPPSAMEP